jgi:uncharacterized protein
MPRSQPFLCRSLVLVLWALPLPAQVPKCEGMQPGGLRVATGSPGGSYLRAGIALRDAAPELDIRPCTTEGTIQNLALLSSNQVELAIAQSDLLHAGWNFETLPSLEDKNSKKAWANIQFDKVELVSWLFSERLQVITSAHAFISSLRDLKGKRVWLGLPTSGAYATSGEVLRAAGVDPAQLDARPKQVRGYTEANEELLNGQLDAIFRITAVPMDYRRDLTPDERPSTISELFRKGPEIRMLSLDQALVDRLLEGSAYVEATIYRDTYPRLGSGVRTIGLGSVLLTRQGLNPQEKNKIHALYRTLHTRRGQKAAERMMNIELDLLGRKLDRANIDDAKILTSHVFAPVAQDLEAGTRAGYKWLAVLAVLAALFLAAVYRSEGLLTLLGNQSRYMVTAGILLAACALFALILWVDERQFSPAFSTPLAAVESLFLYFARGMKSDALMTENGQFFALFALAVIATLVHRLHSDALDDSVKSWSQKLKSRLLGRAGHLSGRKLRVVLNWNDLARRRVEEWSKPPGENSRGKRTREKDSITVVCPNPLDSMSASLVTEINLIPRDPSQRKVLEANLDGASTVLICSAWRSPYPEERRRGISRELADSLTIRTIYCIRYLERGRPPGDPVPIVAEILLSANEEEARAAGGPNLELVTPAARPVALPQGPAAVAGTPPTPAVNPN